MAQEPESSDLHELFGGLYSTWKRDNLALFVKKLKDLEELQKNQKTPPDYAKIKSISSRIILSDMASAPGPRCKYFVNVFLNAMDNVDITVTTRSMGFNPVHYAVRNGNFQVLKCFLDHGIDPNTRDYKGRTPLHILVGRQAIWNHGDFKNHKECLILLLEQPDIDLTLRDKEGRTAEEIAKKCNKDAYYMMLQSDERISPDLIQINNQLMDLLLDEEEAEFKIIWQSELNRGNKRKRGLLQYDNGKHTFLQLACELVLIDSVKLLIANGANPNLYSEKKESPIYLAIENGYEGILKVLLESENLLKGENEKEKSPLLAAAKLYYRSPAHEQCFDFVIKKMEENNEWIDINQQDQHGNTALHYAAFSESEEAIKQMLKLNAKLSIKNKLKQTPLEKMSIDVLEDFLDSQIQIKKAPGSRELVKSTFQINYSFLKAAAACLSKEEETRNIPSTEMVMAMKKLPHLKTLLSHPVLSTLIFLKWRRIRLIYFLNFIFYLAFCITLTFYTLWLKIPWPEDKFPLFSKILPENEEVFPRTKAFLMVLTVLLILRELFQIVIYPKRYFQMSENYLEIILILTVSFLVVNECDSKQDIYSPCPHLGAISILLSWFELFLLLRHVKILAVQVDLLLIVFNRFIKFLPVYFLIILSFAMAFLVLFHNIEPVENSCDSDKSFDTLGLAIFKTFIMMSGEFNSDGLRFDNYEGTSHLIFLLFVFLIAIVLVNLLNGLAVHDTKIIQDDALILFYSTRLIYINSLEKLFKRNRGRIFNFFFKHFVFTPDEIEININENHGNEVMFQQNGSTHFIKPYLLRKNVLEKNIIEEFRKRADNRFNRKSGSGSREKTVYEALLSLRERIDVLVKQMNSNFTTDC